SACESSSEVGRGRDGFHIWGFGRGWGPRLIRLLWALSEGPPQNPCFPDEPFSSVKIGTPPRESKQGRGLTSSGVFTVLSRYSRSSARPMPPTRPTRKESAMLRVLAGRVGVEGIIAGSTQRILDDLRPAANVASFSLVSRPSYMTLLPSASRFRMLYSTMNSDI